MGLNDFAESKVTVKKAELLTAIRSNRETHVKEYGDALVGYRDRVIKRLELTLTSVKDGSSFDPGELLSLREPQSHEKDYERTIRMLEMSIADEVTISAGQFSQFVLDDWSWKADFSTTNALYNSKGPKR